jgi:hypothetical protein
LENERLDILPRLDQEFDLSAFTFGQGLAELSARGLETNASAAKADSAPKTQGIRRRPSTGWNESRRSRLSTAIGDAIRETMNRKRGQPLAGIVLVTDGVNNSGSQPRGRGCCGAVGRGSRFTFTAWASRVRATSSCRTCSRRT